MRLSRLREFIIVAEQRNFTQAAKRAYITQPVLSKHMKALENELGVSLFKRRSSGVEPTEAGMVFYSHAIKIVDEYKSAVDEINCLAEGDTQALTIGYLRDPSRPVLLPLCRWFELNAPQYRVRLKSIGFENQEKILTSKQCDVLLTFDTSPEMRTVCNVEPIYEESLVAVMSRDNPLANNDVVHFRDIALQRHFIAKPSITSDLRAYTSSMLSSVEGALPSMESDDIYTMINMAEWGYGVAVVASHNQLVYQDRCAFVPIADEEQYTFSFAAMWLKETEHDEGGARKIEYLRRALEHTKEVFGLDTRPPQ